MSEQHEIPKRGTSAWRDQLPGKFQFFDINEVAEILRLHPNSVRLKIQSKEINAIKPRRKWLIREDWLQDYIYRAYGSGIEEEQ